MKEKRKELFPTSGLGKLQREILEIICNDFYIHTEPSNTKTLSRTLAKKHNELKIGKKGKEIFTKTHNENMSKSLRRLKERGLIKTKVNEKNKLYATDMGIGWCEMKNEQDTKVFLKEHLEWEEKRKEKINDD